MKFQRGRDPKESMSIGEKHNFYRIDHIEVKICKRKTADNAKILGDFRVISKSEGAEVLKKLMKLSDKFPIWRLNEESNRIATVPSFKILYHIFPRWLMEKFSIELLCEATHVVINYGIDPPYKKGVVGIVGGNIVWRKTDEIYEIKLNEIEFKK